MAEIPLTRGYVAIVDDEDAEEMSRFRWFTIATRGLPYAARTAWTSEGKGKRTVLMHRVLLGIDGIKGVLCDHINDDTLDNRRANLRRATHSQNMGNKRTNGRSQSGYRGVFRSSGATWVAQIDCKRVTHRLGRFANEVDAAHAYDAKAIELFGEFARLNFPIALGGFHD